MSDTNPLSRREFAAAAAAGLVLASAADAAQEKPGAAEPPGKLAIDGGERAVKTPPSHAPRWGEPELVMMLAYAYASSEPLDLARAETLANEALALRPEWKYVKATLLPDIRAKRAAKTSHAPGTMTMNT